MSRTNYLGIILALEMEISLLENDLEYFVADLEYLQLLNSKYMYNIAFHKQMGIVTSISEWKKINIEIGIIQNNILKTKNKISATDRKLNEKMKAVEFYNIKYANEYDDLEYNILEFKK